MKIKCEVINDLLPLYVDDVLSKESRELVEEHISECENCRKTLENMSGKVSIPVSKELRMDDTKHLKGLKKIVKHYKVLAVIFGVIAVLGILMATTLIMCQIQYDVPYDGKNVTLERRGSGYYLVYHGKGSIGYSADSDTDSSEYYISFSQTAYSRFLWPLYHNNEDTMWFCEAGKITKLSTKDGKVIWEANEAEMKEHEQWLLEHPVKG